MLLGAGPSVIARRGRGQGSRYSEGSRGHHIAHLALHTRAVRLPKKVGRCAVTAF